MADVGLAGGSPRYRRQGDHLDGRSGGCSHLPESTTAGAEPAHPGRGQAGGVRVEQTEDELHRHALMKRGRWSGWPSDDHPLGTAFKSQGSVGDEARTTGGPRFRRTTRSRSLSGQELDRHRRRASGRRGSSRPVTIYQSLGAGTDRCRSGSPRPRPVPCRCAVVGAAPARHFAPLVSSIPHGSPLVEAVRAVGPGFCVTVSRVTVVSHGASRHTTTNRLATVRSRQHGSSTRLPEKHL